MGKQKGKSRNKSKGGSLKKKELSREIQSIFVNAPSRVLNYKQIASQLEIRDTSTRNMITAVLYDLKDQGMLTEVHKGRFKLKSARSQLSGKVDLTRMGYAFIVSEEMEEDVFVSQRNLKGALHGDTVRIMLYARRKGTRPEGQVVEVTERARTTYVGKLEVMPQFAFLIPDNRRMPYDLFIPLEKLNGAEQGQKAIARVTDWNPKSKNPVAEIVKVLGFPGEHETEMHAILAEFELPYEFPEEVEQAAADLPTGISKEEIARRRDFRKVPTFTIDPADAKDFDDALSLQKLKNGNWEVGVHIADVTHYIQEGSILEKEAAERATSVYLVDRVVPMLPEKLSNNVCSLKPNEPKLCYSAVFELSDEAEVQKRWFGRTIILSDKRFSYQDAQAVIDTGEGEMSDMMLKLHSMAQILRQNRFKTGAFAFEKKEVAFDLNEEGKPVRVKFRQFGTANQLIEEFMLLANRLVAEFIGKTDKPKTFVYRIHDTPDPEKMENFRQFVKRFGYTMTEEKETALAKGMNKLLKKVKGKNEQNIIETLALRAMAKAVYSTENIGHYGLAFRHYTHFTSPIRRYPDMMVHRLLTAYLNGEASKKEEIYEKLCEHSSKMERLAIEAERSSIKYKQVEFMSDKVGEVFEGVISGVTEWGIYVELVETLSEGMVSIRDLGDDFYEYDEKNYRIAGRHEGKVFTLGDPLKVEVVNVNIDKKQIDFRIA